MTPKYIILALFCAILASSGAICIKHGLNIRPFVFTVKSFTGLASNPWFLFGAGIQFVSVLLWYFIVSASPLGIAFPVVRGMNFLLVPALSFFVLHEKITLPDVLGIALIISGIFLLSMPKTG